MRRFALVAVLMALLFMAGCQTDEERPLPTSLPPAPTAGAEGAIADTPTTAPATAEPPTEAPTEAALPTLPPPTAAPEQPTATAETAPTAAASPTSEPTPTSEPPTAAPGGEGFAPGQQDTATLAEGQSKAYLYNGTQFQPAVLFVEPESELDVALAVYAGDATGGTPGSPPLAQADNTLAGRPEILVLSPDASGQFTFVVTAVSVAEAGGQGAFTAHLYSPTTAAMGMAVQQADTLAAGEAKTYAVTSRGPRPVLAMVDPTDTSDVALDILDANGAVLTTSNYSGPGGIEVGYVLPLGTTNYIIQVRESTGAASTYVVAIVTLE
jgi:hypothetical protein